MPTEIHRPINCWCGSDHAPAPTEAAQSADGLRAALEPFNKTLWGDRPTGDYAKAVDRLIAVARAALSAEPPATALNVERLGWGNSEIKEDPMYHLPRAAAEGSEPLDHVVLGRVLYEAADVFVDEKQAKAIAAAYATPDTSDEEPAG